MTYCSKCGYKNEDEANFCIKCGTSLTSSRRKDKDEWEQRCEEDCAGGKHGAPVFWGVIIILIGLWVLFEFVIKNIVNLEGLPEWVQNFQFWWLIALVIAIALISAGIRMITQRE